MDFKKFNAGIGIQDQWNASINQNLLKKIEQLFHVGRFKYYRKVKSQYKWNVKSTLPDCYQIVC